MKHLNIYKETMFEIVMEKTNTEKINIEYRTCPKCSKYATVRTGYKLPVLICNDCDCKMIKSKEKISIEKKPLFITKEIISRHIFNDQGKINSISFSKQRRRLTIRLDARVGIFPSNNFKKILYNFWLWDNELKICVNIDKLRELLR